MLQRPLVFLEFFLRAALDITFIFALRPYSLTGLPARADYSRGNSGGAGLEI
jgi:hypothetical protein